MKVESVSKWTKLGISKRVIRSKLSKEEVWDSARLPIRSGRD